MLKTQSILEHIIKYFAHRRTRCCVDIGAGAGDMTVEYAHMFDTVIAFEPVQTCRHELPPSVKWIKSCVSNSEDPVKMHIDDQAPDLTHRCSAGTLEVDAHTLDSYQIPNLDFVSIDCEGMEGQCMDGAWQTIKINKPVIMFAHDPQLSNLQSGEPWSAPQFFGIDWMIGALKHQGYQFDYPY